MVCIDKVLLEQYRNMSFSPQKLKPDMKLDHLPQGLSVYDFTGFKHTYPSNLLKKDEGLDVKLTIV